MTDIIYKVDLVDVNWAELKTKLCEDNFDNGRTPAQLETSFRNSQAVVVAYAGDAIVGKVRALSDGVCNAYIVDVWTYSPYRGQGIAKAMLQRLLNQLPGQHVYLFTDDARGLYEKLGFQPQGTGMAKVVGDWLVN